jgi:hypothetical protein
MVDETRYVRPSVRDRRFAAFLVAEAVNSVGSWASAIALWGFAAYRFDASPGQVSLLIICWSVPSAVLGPFLGVLVDRLCNRTHRHWSALRDVRRTRGVRSSPSPSRAL